MSDFITYQLALNTMRNRSMPPQTVSIAPATPTVTTYYTILSVAGSGYLLALGARMTASGTNAASLSFRITIDGNPPQFVKDTTAIGMLGGAPYDNGSGAITTGVVYMPLTPGVRFKTSLLVEIIGFNGTSPTVWNGSATYVLV